MSVLCVDSFDGGNREILASDRKPGVSGSGLFLSIKFSALCMSHLGGLGGSKAWFYH